MYSDYNGISRQEDENIRSRFNVKENEHNIENDYRESFAWKKFEFQYMFKPISYKRRDMENKFRGSADKESFRGIGTKSELNYSFLTSL